MKIASIESVGKSDVFNLHVEGTHSFLANGVVVHNCYDETRYFCMARPLPVKELKPKATVDYDPFRSYRRE
jgi:hypothetical protein